MMKSFFSAVILFSLTCVFSVSCTKDKVCCDGTYSTSVFSMNPLKANVRIKNNTPYNLCSIVFDPTAGFSNPDPINDHHYGHLLPQEYTDYMEYDLVYSYGWFGATIKQMDYVLGPYDYIGEVPLPPGNYVFEISWNEEFADNIYQGISMKLVYE